MEILVNKLYEKNYYMIDYTNISNIIKNKKQNNFYIKNNNVKFKNKNNK